MSVQTWLRAIGIVLVLVVPLAAEPPQERGQNFVPLRQPRFVPAAQAEFLKNEDRVVGVAENGVAKAYEPDVTAWHHVIEDRLAERPIIVTWCSLCNTPLVYKAEVDGRKLTFERAGNRGNNFYMSDSETGSHWQQIGGECFEGPMKGKRLTLVPFLLTTWGEWRATHPTSLVLVPEPAHRDQYAAMAKRISTIAYGSNQKPGRELIREADTRLANYEQVIGVEAGGAHKAYPIAELRKDPVINDAVGSTPIVLMYAAASDTTAAFLPMVGGRKLTFRAAEPGTVVDNETGSKWTIYGECTAGMLKGSRLDRVVPMPGLWFAWSEFYPDTQVYSAPAHQHPR